MAGLVKPIVVVVCGPTASSKTGLALELSREFCGEMICADSMQIYRGLPIGTAAVTPQEAQGIPQHLTGFVAPQNAYSVAEYVADADAVIQAITARGALPVVCGGTGLYISSLVEGTRFSLYETSTILRQRLEVEWQQFGGEGMLQKLAQYDARHASHLHPSDKKRIIRALELCITTGQTALQREAASKPLQPPYNVLCMAPNYPREELYARINMRVDAMLEQGLMEEAKMVYQNRESFKTAVQAIGYKELFPYFEGTSDLQACVLTLQQATRNYAKRQLTWFRRMPQVQWLAPENMAEKAAKLVKQFLEV